VQIIFSWIVNISYLDLLLVYAGEGEWCQRSKNEQDAYRIEKEICRGMLVTVQSYGIISAARNISAIQMLVLRSKFALGKLAILVA
jgi:hypothetical protein